MITLLHMICMEWNVLQKRKKTVSFYSWSLTYNKLEVDLKRQLCAVWQAVAWRWYHLSVHIVNPNFCVQSNRWFIIHYTILWYCVQSAVFLLGVYQFESVLETLQKVFLQCTHCNLYTNWEPDKDFHSASKNPSVFTDWKWNCCVQSNKWLPSHYNILSPKYCVSCAYQF